MKSRSVGCKIIISYESMCVDLFQVVMSPRPLWTFFTSVGMRGLHTAISRKTSCCCLRLCTPYTGLVRYTTHLNLEREPQRGKAALHTTDKGQQPYLCLQNVSYKTPMLTLFEERWKTQVRFRSTSTTKPVLKQGGLPGKRALKGPRTKQPSRSNQPQPEEDPVGPLP